MEVSGQLHNLCLFTSRETTAGIQWIGGWLGHAKVWKLWRTSLSPAGYRTPVAQPVAKSLYRLSCSGFDIWRVSLKEERGLWLQILGFLGPPIGLSRVAYFSVETALALGLRRQKCCLVKELIAPVYLFMGSLPSARPGRNHAK
jgi:hypothetical protein